MNILAIVTARAGSRSVPNKNLLPFGSETALSLRIKATRIGLPGIDIVISTDSEEYAEVATRAGVECPFLRPLELASDEAASSDVIAHALEWLKERGRIYDAFVLVEPSSPFCRPEDYRVGIDLLKKTDGPVVSVREAHPNPIFISKMGPEGEFSELADRLKKDIRRQAFAQEYTPSGCFYAAYVEQYLKHRTFYLPSTRAFAMPTEYSVEIDEPSDALYAQWLWNSGYIERELWS